LRDFGAFRLTLTPDRIAYKAVAVLIEDILIDVARRYVCSLLYFARVFLTPCRLISQTPCEKFTRGLNLYRTRKTHEDISPIPPLKVKANEDLAHLRATVKSYRLNGSALLSIDSAVASKLY